MRPPYATLKAGHHSSDKDSLSFVSAADMYGRIGYDIESLKKENPGYDNTCALRMSLALLKVGVPFAGRLTIKSGPFKGKKVEPGAFNLANQLLSQSAFGNAETSNDGWALREKIKDKRGVIFFWRLASYAGGHIDMVEPSTLGPMCNSHCYFNCKEVWFWALP